MNELIVFSWNVLKKSLKHFQATPDTVTRLIAGILSALEANGADIGTPFVGFLLEITGSDRSVRGMCKILKAEYRSQTGQDADFEAHSSGGVGATRESIITISRGVRMVSEEFDARGELSKFVASDKQNAENALTNHNNMIANRGLRVRKKQRSKAKSDIFRSARHEPDWYRNGVMVNVRYGNDSIRIAAIHAPGPNLSSKVAEVVDAIVTKASDQNVDILIGDLNRHGVFGTAFFDDLSGKWSSGTSFKKSATPTLGESRWDRILVNKTRAFEIDSADPIPVARPAELNLGMLTDHAIVHARVYAKAVTIPVAQAAGTIPNSLLGSSDIVMTESPLVQSVTPSLTSPLAATDASSLASPLLSSSTPAPVSSLLSPPPSIEPNPLMTPSNPTTSEALLSSMPNAPTGPLSASGADLTTAEGVPATLPSVPKGGLTSMDAEELAIVLVP